MKFLWPLYCLIAIACFSCDIGDVDPEEVEFGYDFFPLDAGLYREYEVTSVMHKTLGVEEDHYYLKEVQQAPVTQSEETSYPVYSYRRNDTLSDWVLDSVFAEVRTSGHAYRDQSNRRFLKLTFPLQTGDVWDGNIANVRTQDNIILESINEPYSLSSGISFDETVVTVRDYIQNDVEVDTRLEVYARGVGLILMEEEVTNTQPGKATFGFEMTKTLVDYGPK